MKARMPRLLGGLVFTRSRRARSELSRLRGTSVAKPAAPPRSVMNSHRLTSFLPVGRRTPYHIAHRELSFASQQNRPLLPGLGHSRPMHSVRVPTNVRCYSNSAIIIRRSAVTLRADTVAKVLLHR